MRWVKRIFLSILVLVVLASAFLFFLVRNSFPQVDGEITVGGLNSQVEVIRDEWGVPHIYASTTHDLFFAQGYTHAQERFWQMDFWRHIGAGRLSELFGEDQVETDMFLRSLGFTVQANQELAAMSARSRSILQSYADGVNAYLEGRGVNSLSLEYTILGLQNSSYEVEPWSPVNTLTWAKLMSWDLSGNLSDEIDRTVIASNLPVDRVEQLYPPFPEGHPYIVGGPEGSMEVEVPGLPDAALGQLLRVARDAERVWSLTGGGFEGIGSNSWVLSGSKTRSGLPILANDTHLANQIPAIWFANGLHCVPVGPDCPFRVVGFSFAGVPAVVVGHNERIAWGVTTQSVDTQDLFIEKVNPDNERQYEVEGMWVDFETRRETLRVAGGDDVIFEVRVSRNGPIVSGTLIEEDLFDDSSALETPDDFAVALAWSSLRPSLLVEAFIGLNLAGNYDDFREATANWDIAAQNVVYADVDGNIAYQSTGSVPVRAAGNGRYPVPGWTGEYDWVGTVPFEEMPALFNPPSGYIVTANQFVIPASSEPFLTADGGHGYRAARITELLAASGGLDVGIMQGFQVDSRDGGAARVVPYLLAIDAEGDFGLSEIQDELRLWLEADEPLQARWDSSGAAAYQSIWRHILTNTFHDDLPEVVRPYGGGRWFTVVAELLEAPNDPYWNDINTDEVENRDDILRLSMVDAYDELSSLFRNRGAWSWGRLHTASFENPTFGLSGIGPIEWLFNRDAPPRVGGSGELVNANGWDAAVGYEVVWIPSQRMVVDFDDFNRSTFLHSTGQSGHAFHRHYTDMIEPWTDGLHAPLWWSRQSVEDNARSTLILLPGE